MLANSGLSPQIQANLGDDDPGFDYYGFGAEEIIEDEAMASAIEVFSNLNLGAMDLDDSAQHERSNDQQNSSSSVEARTESPSETVESSTDLISDLPRDTAADAAEFYTEQKDAQDDDGDADADVGLASSMFHYFDNAGDDDVFGQLNESVNTPPESTNVAPKSVSEELTESTSFSSYFGAAEAAPEMLFDAPTDLVPEPDDAANSFLDYFNSPVEDIVGADAMSGVDLNAVTEDSSSLTYWDAQTGQAFEYFQQTNTSDTYYTQTGIVSTETDTYFHAGVVDQYQQDYSQQEPADSQFASIDGYLQQHSSESLYANDDNAATTDWQPVDLAAETRYETGGDLAATNWQQEQDESRNRTDWSGATVQNELVPDSAAATWSGVQPRYETGGETGGESMATNWPQHDVSQEPQFADVDLDGSNVAPAATSYQNVQ